MGGEENVVRSIFLDQALANQHINRLWLQALQAVPFDLLDSYQGAFFDSIFGTWNHILLGDRIWLGRIGGHSYPFESLRQRLCADMATLSREREVTDRALVSLVQGESDFERTVRYRGNQGQSDEQRLYQILNHLFAHQQHHRGQISQMCHRLRIPVPDGGLIGYYRGNGSRDAARANDDD